MSYQGFDSLRIPCCLAQIRNTSLASSSSSSSLTGALGAVGSQPVVGNRLMSSSLPVTRMEKMTAPPTLYRLTRDSKVPSKMNSSPLCKNKKSDHNVELDTFHPNSIFYHDINHKIKSIHHDAAKIKNKKNLEENNLLVRRNSTSTISSSAVIHCLPHSSSSTLLLVKCLSRILYEQIYKNVGPTIKIAEIFSESNSELPSKDNIYEYLIQICESHDLCSWVVVMTIAYIDRLKIFSGIVVNKDNWKRIVFVAMLVAYKMWNDSTTWSEEFMEGAQIEMSMHLLNRLERHFLRFIEYKLMMYSSDYTQYYFELVTRRENSKQDEVVVDFEELDYSANSKKKSKTDNDLSSNIDFKARKSFSGARSFGTSSSDEEIGISPIKTKTIQ